MGTELHNVLRSLCLNTDWKYAALWKLKHRDRMVLTCEDAYCDNFELHVPVENDTLGLAMAKMWYHVYSLGEGIIGQVAVTGKHQWITADKQVTNLFSSFAFSDGWQSQLSAGIKTVVVVAVVPCGVVELGSLKKIAENMKLLTHIKDAFSPLQDSMVENVSCPVQHGMKSSLYVNTAVELTNKRREGGSSISVNIGSFKLLQPRSYISYSEQQNQVGIHKFGACLANFPVDLLDSTVCGMYELDGADFHLNRSLNMPELSSTNLKKDSERKLEDQAGSSYLDTSDTFLKYTAGYELHEALGMSFPKGGLYFDHKEEKIDSECIVEVPEGISFSQITTETTAEPHFHANQESIVRNETQNGSISTGVCDAMSAKEFSLICPAMCCEKLSRCSEPAKSNKRRARPGKSCRMRLRDRQLIQDRIKELRELVPDSTKCSIDSLLERTVKHMLFLESITEHTDKLNQLAKPKKEADTSNYQKGSTWAVGVGGHLKVSSIMVENLNNNGQMLIEMLCDECSRFFEMAKAIKSLGLTILKGITEMHGEKTWICFIVEAQRNSKVTHRMGILLSLVQILQPQTSS